MRISSAFVIGLLLSASAGEVRGQAAPEARGQAARSEVRQIVSFVFTPGAATEAREVFRELALPLYQQDEAMLRFRGLREVESPVPVDMVVVSTFDGMAGMDRSNAALSRLRTDGGTGIGDFYGRIGPLIAEHDDQFVEMLSASASGSPYAESRTVLVRYRIVPGQRDAFEAVLRRVEAWEAAEGVPGETGRFLVSDGWNYMRWIGLDSLGAYQDYWAALDRSGMGRLLDELTVARTEIILASLPEFDVR